MDTALAHLSPVVLCGQTGNELWPLLRMDTPREAARLPFESESLLATTIRRVKPLTGNPIMFVCSAEAAPHINQAILDSGLVAPGEYELLIETYPHGTALSIALAAAKLKRRDALSYMLVMPSHLTMEDDELWEQAVTRAYRAAAEDYLALIATESRESIVRHSFIKPGKSVRGVVGAKHIASFIAAPTPQQQSRYTHSGMLWSTGMFMGRATAVQAQLIHVANHSASLLSRGMDRVAETAQFLTTIDEEKWASNDARELIESLPDVSFERAVLEASQQTVVIPTNLACTLISSLSSLDDLVAADGAGNRTMGKGFAIDSTNTTVYDDDRLTVTLGCDDLLVVSTRDAVLVADKYALDTLPEVLPALMEAGVSEAATSDVELHNWGKSTTVFSSDTCRVRIVEIEPGMSINPYETYHAEENWEVLEGTLVSRQNGGTRTIRAGQRVEYRAGVRHELRNDSEEQLRLTCTERFEGRPDERLF